MATARIVTPAHVEQVDISQEGIVITFQNQKKAFFDAQYLYDHQDVSGNFPLDEDDLEIE
jgi:hypothetical protein